jgi:hypothetical protein
MKLSILIPTVPQRANFYLELTTELYKQIEMENAFGLVEILTDDAPVGSKTTGSKRNDLVNLAQGQYVWFIDDDDCVSDTAIKDVLNGIETDCDSLAICGTYSENGTNFRDWYISKDLEYTTIKINGKDVFLRPPNHITPMKRSISLQIMFPDKSKGEDYDFCMRLKSSGLIKTEYKIEKPIYHYRYVNYNKLY